MDLDDPIEEGEAPAPIDIPAEFPDEEPTPAEEPAPAPREPDSVPA